MNKRRQAWSPVVSLRLLLDEDAQDKDLVKQLRSTGHDVMTVNELRLRTLDDREILRAAWADHRLLVTYNVDDFRNLHAAGVNHSGIAVICRDADPSKDMSISDIVRALGNIEASGIPVSAQLLILNHWQY